MAIATAAAAYSLTQLPITNLSSGGFFRPRTNISIRNLSFSDRLSAKPLSLPLHLHLKHRHLQPISSPVKLKLSASCLPSPPSLPPTEPSLATTPAIILSDSTRTISTIISSVLALSSILLAKLAPLSLILNSTTLCDIQNLRSLNQSLICYAGPLFFAARKYRSRGGAVNTPLTVVAAGMAKWLDIYSTVLTVRVMLSWYPNVPWDRQPLSAIRDICDPYLNLFRNIIPPVFGALDVSPLLGFAVLGTLGSILRSSMGTY